PRDTLALDGRATPRRRLPRVRVRRRNGGAHAVVGGGDGCRRGRWRANDRHGGRWRVSAPPTPESQAKPSGSASLPCNSLRANSAEASTGSRVATVNGVPAGNAVLSGSTSA